MIQLNDLPDIRNYLYDKAERFWWYSLYFYIGIPILSVMILNLNIIWLQTLFGFIALLSPFGIVWIREIAAQYTIKADKCRRLILYADGLGNDIPHIEQIKLKALVKNANIKSAVFESPYYTSSFSHGPYRLIDIVKESAFFTSELSKEVSEILKILLVILFVVFIFVFYYGITITQHAKEIQNIAKSAIIIVSFLYCGDFYWLWRKYSTYCNETDKILHKCTDILKNGDLKISDVFQIIEDYHLLINSNPPIPKALYIKNYEKLNRIYRETYFPDGL